MGLVETDQHRLKSERHASELRFLYISTSARDRGQLNDEFQARMDGKLNGFVRCFPTWESSGEVCAADPPVSNGK